MKEGEVDNFVWMDIKTVKTVIRQVLLRDTREETLGRAATTHYIK